MNGLIILLFTLVLIQYAICESCCWCTEDINPGVEQMFKNLGICDEKDLHRFILQSARTAVSNSRPLNRPTILLRAVSNTYNPCLRTTPTCNPNYKFRSIDGSCNNLNNPNLGRANTVYNRILPAIYRDGTYLPRLDTDGNVLPSARTLSTAFFPEINSESVQVTLAVMQWGQFIAHDIIASMDTPNVDDCCNGLSATNEDVCLPIQVPRNDLFYSQFNITCQSMVRHVFAPRNDCGGVAQQINTVSHLIDGSQIYGSNVNVTRSLRGFQKGRLVVQRCSPRRSYLPNVSGRTECVGNFTGNTTYLAGDSRVNQNPQLSVVHTLFAREHNRIASRLQQMHPNWNDERVYQETRAIVVAELQHITYNEWLPLLLGRSFTFAYGLCSSNLRNFTYNSNVTPVTINSFASAAYRIGHSAIQGQVSMCNAYNACPLRVLNFSDWLERPGIIQQQENFDGLLRGLINQPMQNLDNYYTQQITQQFFHENSPFGTDLISTDIQRGRDHGLPPYVNFLEICTGRRPQTFSDLAPIIKPGFISQLQNHYRNVNDIDLFIGGNLEARAPGARVGPTFRCIIAEQFYRYKYGDRYWYEIRGQRHSFTDGQLYEIKKASLSRLVCDNSDGIINVSLNSFMQNKESNRPVACQQIPSVNLNRWK